MCVFTFCADRCASFGDRFTASFTATDFDSVSNSDRNFYTDSACTEL
jgi:hypothetical protein